MDFWKDYYINSEISNYQNYTEKKYGYLCEELIKILWIEKDDNIVDRGCATWNLIREFANRGYTNIKGSDISERAIQYWIDNWLQDFLQSYNPEILSEDNQHVIMNDVLEHMLEDDIREMLNGTNWLITLRLPVCAKEWEDYVLECSRVDKTHIQRHTKDRWIELFNECGYTVETINWKHIYDSKWVLAVTLTKWE